jgi:hypothetical protein
MNKLPAKLKIMDFILGNFIRDKNMYVIIKIITDPIVASVVAVIFPMVSGDVDKAIKIKLTTTVEGNDNIIPAIFLSAFSAKKLKIAIAKPPITKEVANCI